MLAEEGVREEGLTALGPTNLRSRILGGLRRNVGPNGAARPALQVYDVHAIRLATFCSTINRDPRDLKMPGGTVDKRLGPLLRLAALFASFMNLSRCASANFREGTGRRTDLWATLHS